MNWIINCSLLGRVSSGDLRCKIYLVGCGFHFGLVVRLLFFNFWHCLVDLIEEFSEVGKELL